MYCFVITAANFIFHSGSVKVIIMWSCIILCFRWYTRLMLLRVVSNTGQCSISKCFCFIFCVKATLDVPYHGFTSSPVFNRIWLKCVREGILWGPWYACIIYAVCMLLCSLLFWSQNFLINDFLLNFLVCLGARQMWEGVSIG